jgi:hypothetical protein
MGDDRNPEAEQRAAEHAWRWFALHANQRMQIINYFLVVLALVVAGYGAAIEAENALVARVIVAAGLVMTGAFYTLERRTRHLVKLAEQPLKELERRMSVDADLATLTMTSGAEAPGKGIAYSVSVRALMAAAFLLMIVALLATWVVDVDDPAKHPTRMPTSQSVRPS